MYKTRITLTAVLIICLLVAFAWLMPGKSTVLSLFLGAGIAFVITLYFAVSIGKEKRRIEQSAFRTTVFSLSFLTAVLPPIFGAVLYMWGIFSFLTWGLLIGLTLTFFFNFLSIPLSLYHRFRESEVDISVSGRYPSVSILMPAYNEEKVLGRAIESLIEATYPDKEIIIIDDGSTDRTYAIALRYSGRGVKVLQRPNGGKSAALNYGLRFSKGEIIVCVDADSLVTKNAIIELVKRFRDPKVGASRQHQSS